MKKLMLLFSFLYFLVVFSFSQDLIIKTNGEEIKSKVLEITQTEIKYKKYDLQNGPQYTIDKAVVFMIKYENGAKDIISSSTDKDFGISNNLKTKEDLSLKGKNDAKAYYKGKNSGAGWTTATTIVFSPIIGVIPAAICSMNEPEDQNLNYHDEEIMKNKQYSNAYIDEAHKIKKKKIWRNFGIGSGVWLGIILLL